VVSYARVDWDPETTLLYFSYVGAAAWLGLGLGALTPRLVGALVAAPLAVVAGAYVVAQGAMVFRLSLLSDAELAIRTGLIYLAAGAAMFLLGLLRAHRQHLKQG